MTISRRKILLQGGAIGAGIISANITGIAALAQAQPPQRRSLGDLAWNDPIVAAYRDAVGQMKKKPSSEQFSWINLANIHGDENDFHFCPHGNWYFLPWHRAFTLMYERVVRQLTGFSAFAMPYWDWTADRQIPFAFANATTPDGKPNPLFEPSRSISPTDSLPDEWVGPSVIQSVLASVPYENFGTSRPSGQNSLDQSWIIDQGGGVQGVLESTPHNNIHNWIGGWMPTSASPRDPIFFMHHCNIDRLWSVWNAASNQDSADPLWINMPFQKNFYNVDGSFWSPLVSDLLVPETLGYTYTAVQPALAAEMSVAAPPSVLSLGDKLKILFATPDVKSAAGIKTFTTQNSEQAIATASKPLEISVEANRAEISAVVQRKPVSAGNELLNFNAGREQAASGTHALAFIRDVTVTRPQATMYRVFIDCDYLSPDTPVSDPHFVGTFGILEHGGHGGHASKPSFALDLTRAIQRIYGSATTIPDRIRVQILPLPNKPAAGETGTVGVSRVEIAFVSV